jgi:short-subunit dehydrogenase
MSSSSLVFITGATGGLGKAFSHECAARGWDLFLTDLSEKALDTLAHGLHNAYGVNVDWKTANLCNLDSRRALYDFIRDKGYKFRLLINVAGLDYEGAFTDRHPDQIRTLLRLNIEANLETTFALLPLRDRSRPFRIINVASLAAFYPMPLKAMYSSSKRFILQFSLALREELRSAGVSVTTLCPAGLPTTAECIKSIEAQGIAGKITTKNVGFVAAETIDRALKGHAVYIPGMFNRLIRLLGEMVPQTIIAKLICNRWKNAREKVLVREG